MIDNIDVTEKARKEAKKKAIEKTGWMVTGGLIFAFLVTICTFYALGIFSVNIHVALFTGIMFLYPLAFFFLGMSVVFRKKLYPLKK